MTLTATLALVCYEHLMTIQYEYLMLTQRQWTGATCVFMLNRYALLVSTIAAVALPATAEVSPVTIC